MKTHPWTREQVDELLSAAREAVEAFEQMRTAGEYAWAESLQRRCFDRREEAMEALSRAIQALEGK